MARYDLILSGGRVLDPANGLDDVCDVGLKNGRVERVAAELDPHHADSLIDVSGKWVMPGHVDTHAHVAGPARDWDPALGYAMMARAGVTTVLDMGGTGPGLIGGINRRGAGLNVAGLLALVPGSTIPDGGPTPGMLSDAVSDALRQGCVGVKILGGYFPFSPETTSDVIGAANEQRAYVAYHVGTKATGSQLEGVREIPALVGGGRLHVCHVNSYCRGVIEHPDSECDETLSILEGMSGQLNSEAYHAIRNGTSGMCDANGDVVADVPRNCLRLRGYATTREGMRRAILDGYASVLTQAGGQMGYARGKEALRLFERGNTNVGMSFPVNLPTSAFRLTTAKNGEGDFIVDAVSTDGGSLPRNVAIRSTIALTHFGALTPLEMAAKLSWTPARMLGLTNRGHFSEGAEADISVLDPEVSRPVMSFVAGKLIMLHGQVVGSGGTLLVTSEGARTARDSGLPYQVIDLSQSKLYANFR